MSADNGVYIGQFPAENYQGTEYRVIEAQAIDNVDYGSTAYQDHMRVLYFGNAKPLASINEAYVEAQKQAQEVLKNFGVLEYGISTLVFDRPLLKKSVEDAEKWIKLEDKQWARDNGKIPCANPDCSSFTSADYSKVKEGETWFCSTTCKKHGA